MSNKILLISSNQCKEPYPVFPLGVSFIAGALRKRGFSTEIFDMISNSNNLESIINDFQPEFIGISLRNIDDVKLDNPKFFFPDLASTIKKVRAVSKAPVILGGSGFSLFPETILEKTGAEFGITSEGEQALVLLIDAINKQKPEAFDSIPGLVYRKNMNIMTNRPVALDISTTVLPFKPDSLIRYYDSISSILNVQTQRGCPFKCCYCTYPLLEGCKNRYRSPEEITEEILESKDKGARYFFIVDSVFNTNNDHVQNVCEEFIKKDINVPWGCFLRPSSLNNKIMNLMARAGLKHIEFGSDSMCDSVLYDYGKYFTFEDILKSSELAYTNKIHYCHFLIIGGPGESEKTIWESYNNSLKLRKTGIFPYTGMRIYPGTSLYKRALREAIISTDEDLFIPSFYISPDISKEQITEIMNKIDKLSSRWLLNTPQPEQIRVMSNLHKKGLTGPLWEYLLS